MMDMKMLALVVLLCLVQPLRTKREVVEGYLPEKGGDKSGLLPLTPHQTQKQHQIREQNKLQKEIEAAERKVKEKQLKEMEEQEKQKTTLLVPRSNNIQIAFAGNGDDPQTSLHVDLLRLYKEVMEEILQRNKLIQTVNDMIEKMSRVDSLVDRMDRLEMLCTNMGLEAIEGKKGRKVKVKGSGKHTSGKGYDGGDFNNSSTYEEVLGGGHGELGDWEMLVREVTRQGKALWALREERKVDHRLTSELMMLANQQREQMSRMTTQIQEQAQATASLRQQSLHHAQVLEDHTALLDLHQTELEVVGAKVNKISLDVQWQSFKINMNENTTESVKRELTDLEAFLGTSAGSPAVRGTDMFSMWNRAKSDIERCQTEINTMNKKIRDIEEDTQKLVLYLNRERASNFSQVRDPRYNETYIMGMQQFVEDTANRLYNMIHRLNMTQKHMSQRTQQQQGQMDDVSLDLERVKDELVTYSRRLTDTARNVEHLKDYNLHGRREREKLRRKLEKLARDMRQMLQHLGLATDSQYAPPSGQTWVHASSAPQYRSTGSPSWARRTTSARRISHVTPTTHDTSIPATRSEDDITPPPSHQDTPAADRGDLGVTEPSESGGWEWQEEVHPSDNEVLRPVAKETSVAPPTPTPALKNCSVTGFGGRQMFRTFKRILTGAWMKDPTQDEPNIYVLRNNVRVTNVREYANEAAVRNNTALRIHTLPFRCTGTGHVIYNHNLYCNRYKSNRLARFNLRTGHSATAKLRNAGYNNTYPYAAGALTDIDLAIDEQGIWTIYSSETHQGNIVIGKLDPESMAIKRMWVTRFLKADASNTFMVCGRLYTTAFKENQPVEVSYIYDTHSGQEVPVQPGQITFHTNTPDFQTSLDYNPRDKKLYSWVLSKDWDGQLVKYDVYFEKNNVF